MLTLHGWEELKMARAWHVSRIQFEVAIYIYLHCRMLLYDLHRRGQSQVIKDRLVKCPFFLERPVHKPKVSSWLK